MGLNPALRIAAKTSGKASTSASIESVRAASWNRRLRTPEMPATAWRISPSSEAQSMVGILYVGTSSLARCGNAVEESASEDAHPCVHPHADADEVAFDGVEFIVNSCLKEN
jgi:hypothetical protein